MALNAEKKKEAVDSLIANCDCYKEEDRETLNALDDNELVEKVLESNKTQKEALTSNAKKSLEAVTAPIEIDDKTKMVFNAEKNEWEKQIKEEEPVENESKKPMTEKEWLASAPESIRNAFAHSQSLIENERQSLINKIAEAQEDVENARTDLSQKSLDELKTIASFLPERKIETPAPNYEGRGSFVGNRGSSADFDPNDTIPVLDFLSAEFDPEQKSA